MKKTLLFFSTALCLFLNFFETQAQTTLDFQNTGRNSYDYIGSPNLDLSISPKTIRFNYNNASSSGSQGGPNYYISDDGTGSNSNLGLTIVNEISTDALTISYTDNSAFALNALKVIDYNAFFEALYPGSFGPAHQLTIQAYNGSSVTATITYTYTYSGADPSNRKTINTISANAAFGNVTKVVITAAGGLDHMFDDVTIGTAAAAATAPTAVTATPASITSSSASLGGNVTSDGGASVTDRGIVYAVSANPTTSNTKVQLGTGIGSFSQTINGLSASTTYYVRAYAINNQGTSYGANLSFSTSAAPVPLSASASAQTNVACYGGSNGSATVNVTGGTAPYSYSWYPSGGTAATASGLSAGNHTVTVTDAASATTTQNFTLTQPSALSSSGAQTNIACNGTSTGSAAVSVSGGTAPYSYSWRNNTAGTTLPQTTTNVSNLSAGNYTVIITDANGCTTSRSFNLTQPSALVTTGSQTNVTTSGGSDGSATVNVSSGTPGYTYSWSPSGGTAATASGLPAGTYRVTITDANGCTATKDYTITQPAAVTVAPVTTTPANGSISNNRMPAYNGTAPAGSTVTVYVDAVSVGTTTASGGSFSLTQPAALVDGSHTVYATAQTSGQSVSANSNTNTFTLDGTAPGAPVIVTPANGSVTNNNTPIVAGTAEAGATVTLYDSNGTTVLAVTTADGSGNWQASSSTLVEGSHALTAKAKDAAGNTSYASNANTISIDRTAPSVSISSTASGSTTNSTIPVTSTFSEAVTGFTASDVTVTGGTLSGFSGSGSNYSFTVTANASGTITVNIASNVAQDAAGNGNTAASQLSITYTQLVTAAPVVIIPANGSMANTTTPTYSGTAPAGSTIMVYVDGAILGSTTTATSGGNWSLTQPAALAQGSHTVYATAQVTGNSVSANSNTNTFTVDSTRPSVVITSTAGASGSSTSTFPIPFTVTFSESVTGFVAGDITPGNATISGFSGSGTTYTFNATPAANGAVTINIAANVAQDAAGNGNTAASQFSSIYAPLSGNTDLSNLAISTGTFSPGFASGTTSYAAAVSNATTSLAVTPTVSDANASVTVNGTQVTSGNASGSIALNVGSNTITVQVTAQNSSTKAYTLTVTRGAASTNANLSNLTISSGTLSPTFASGTTSYTASVSNGTTSLTVTPTVSNANATVTVNGVVVSSGNTSGAIALNVGSNTITTIVTAQDGSTATTYTLIVTRAASANADLAALSLSSGTLSPAFASGTTSYTASVSNGTTSLAITPAVSNANASVTVNGTPVTSGNASGAIALNAGSNTITTIVTAQDGSTTKTYTLTVTRAQASQTITFAALPVKNYGDAAFNLTVISSSGLPLTYSSSDPAVASVSSAGSVHLLSAGTADITASSPGDANFQPATPVTRTLTINKAALSVTADDQARAFGQPNPVLGLHYTGFVNGDNEASLTSLPVVSTMATAASAAGLYPVLVSGGAAVNYRFVYAAGTLTVNKAPQSLSFAAISSKTYGDADFTITASATSGISVTYTTSNPSVATVSTSGAVHLLSAGTITLTASQAGDANYLAAPPLAQTLTVAKAALSVKADDQAKVYGSANPTLTLSYSGFVSGDDQAVLTSPPAASTTAAITSLPGAYPITVSGALADNYMISYLPGVLRISQASQVIAFGPLSDKTYGDADFTVTASSGAALPLSYLSSNPSVATVSSTGVVHLLSAGTTTFTATQAGNANFAPAAPVSQVLTVKKAILSITADNKTRIFGAANPPLTVGYSGFVNGDSNNSLSTLPVVTTTATTTSAAGPYPITPSGAAAANYSFAYVPGTLTVTGASVNSFSLAQVTVLENQASGAVAGTLNAISADPNANHTYTLVSGNGSTDNSSFSIQGNKLVTTKSFDFEQQSAYSVRLRAINQYGLYLEQTFTVNITDVNEAPTLAAIPAQLVCYQPVLVTVRLTGITPGPESSQSTTLKVSTSDLSLFGDLRVSAASVGIATLSYQLARPGSAVVTVTAIDNGGTANGGTDSFSQSFTVNADELPIAEISSDKGLQISKGETVTLTATGGSIFSWDSTPNVSGTSSSALIKVRPAQTTTYQVKVSNASGCSTTKSITINVADDYALIQAANILTPNGDGKNDTWVVKNLDLYPNNTVSVFDHGGRKIYQAKQYDNSWDGSLNGSPLTEGTYYYVIDFGEGKAPKKGFITILRNR